MGFEAIECVGAAPKSRVPAEGVFVGNRAKPKGGRYITVFIGPDLAKRLCLRADVVDMAVLFGSGSDAGKIALSVDATGGAFTAKRQKSGKFLLTINPASADGLFALDFPGFAVPEVQVFEVRGEPPRAVFTASPEMLAVAA